MPDLVDLIKKWRKQVFIVVLLSVMAVGVITFMKPKQYLGVATSVPASAFAADPGKVFNENIQALYSSLGTPDDLDMILGTGQLDTLFLAVTDEFNLYEHYKMKERGNAARVKAASLLRKNTRVMRSGYGELKVKVWNTDKNLAPQLANSVMATLQSIHQDLQSEGNKSTLMGLKTAKQKLLSEVDSIKIVLGFSATLAGVDDLRTIRLNVLNAQLTKYEKLIIEHELLLSSKPPVLIPVEKARVSEWPDRPKRMQILIATAVLSFLFSILAVLVLERRKFSNL